MAGTAALVGVAALVLLGGGGGGYSGGGGGSHDGKTIFSGGGGGGSFDAGVNQILVADFQTGNGQVIITELAAEVPEPPPSRC